MQRAKAAPRLPAGTVIAAVVSGAMIAQQVAGKAARDALFLSCFGVEGFPAMMAASAVASLAAALLISGLMVRHSPARVVPIAFVVNGAGLLAEWGVSFVAPRITAVALYVHTALFGAVVISAFWSMINEAFAPHSGRRAVAWIASGGTLGGMLGGLVAWRAADLVPLPALLPLLAAINVVCIWGSWRLHAAPAEADAAGATDDEEADAPPTSVFKELWGAPYLRNLALVVGLGAVTSGLLDYVFSAIAVQHYAKGPELLAFFAKFWLVVGILSFVLQTLLGRIALEKLGLTVTVAVLPVVVVLGGLLGIAVPSLFSMVALRGGEATLRNSLFRGAYELLYKPLSERRKRASKTIIDVGCDRIGTVLAGGIAFAAIKLVQAPAVGLVLLVVAIGCTLVSLARSIPIHHGYVALLEEDLRRAADKMRPSSVPALHEKVVEHLEGELDVRAPGEKVESIDRVVRAVLDLRSGQNERVQPVLASDEPLAAPLVAFAILLLADKEFHVDAIRALAKAAPMATGQLVDSLCDARVDFHARRRIPRVLAQCPTVATAAGLLQGIEDPRFEVRYACGRALLKVRAANPAIVLALEGIVGIVTREVARDDRLWCDDDDDDDDERLVDRLLRDRRDRTLEHVFHVLALHLDPESLRTAFKALHETDEAIRGTALEYLETVLPNEVRDLVWPFLGEARPMRAARPAEDVLADLVRLRANQGNIL